MAWHYVKSSSELVDDRASAPVNGRWPTAERLHVTPVQRALVVGGGSHSLSDLELAGRQDDHALVEKLVPRDLERAIHQRRQPPRGPLGPPAPHGRLERPLQERHRFRSHRRFLAKAAVPPGPPPAHTEARFGLHWPMRRLDRYDFFRNGRGNGVGRGVP